MGIKVVIAILITMALPYVDRAYNDYTAYSNSTEVIEKRERNAAYLEDIENEMGAMKVKLDAFMGFKRR